jgi:hypothetical protein
MIPAQQDRIIHIGGEVDFLIATVAVTAHGSYDEWRILNHDSAAFDWRDQPVAAICLALQHAGKQFDKSRPANQPTFMIPAAISRNADIKCLRCRLADLAKGIAWALWRARDMRR